MTSDKVTQCPVLIVLDKSHSWPCPEKPYKDHAWCVFHNPDVIEKENDFRTELARLISDWPGDQGRYFFYGFVFPNINFRKILREIDKPIIFSNCTFLGNANFSGCKFLEKTRFVECEFSRWLRFTDSVFSTRIVFLLCGFQAVSFTRCLFPATTFDQCRFAGNANFFQSNFASIANITACTFKKNCQFGGCVFHDQANFRATHFLKRIQFRNATFLDEVNFSDSHFGFLKNLKARKANFDGVVLEAAQLWEIGELTNYSFRDSFLISLNLADKIVNDCDFTGAVFKAVLVQGWKPNSATIQNTEYIYTDYETTEEQDEYGNKTRVLKRIEESRVPAEGSFGRDEHTDFTVADYLKEPLKWSLALNVPSQFRTAVLNYVQFFTDFMKVTEGVSVEIRTRQEGSKLRVEFMTDTREDKELVQERFKQYRENTTKEFGSLDIRFKANASEVEKELFRIRYEHTINTLKTELNYTQRLLQKEEEKNILQERYLSLLRDANVFSREPTKLLTPANEPLFQQSSTPIFFLTADLKDYSKATQLDTRLYPLIQTFFFNQKELIQQDPVCEAVKLEGDAIKIFFRDGVKLIWIAKRLIDDFENLKYQQPTSIKGFRVVLGYGTSYREQRGEAIDYSGDAIVETCRVDQPMKKYIEAHNERPNQIWCTESFKNEVVGKHSNVLFEELPAMDLDKGFAVNARLFRVRVE